jgi:hypothetical protein
MELLNFQLCGDGISLEWKGQNLDLHNNFDFESIHYALPIRQLEVRWLRSKGQWAKGVTIAGLKLVFKDVKFFKVKERAPEYQLTDDECLAHLSFHSPELRNEFDSISLEASATDDLTFFFESEWGFKVNAKSVELIAL